MSVQEIARARKRCTSTTPEGSVPVPGQSAQMFAWEPTKSYVQTSRRAREPGTGNCLNGSYLITPAC